MPDLPHKPNTFLLFVTALLLGMALLPLHAGAQITIKERMELQAQTSSNPQGSQVLPALPGNAVLYPLAPSAYVVLKTGDLKLFVAGGTLAGPDGAAGAELTVTHFKAEGPLPPLLLTIEPYLQAPIGVTEAGQPSCSEPTRHYVPELSISRTARQDSFVDAKEENRDINYGNFQNMIIAGDGSEPTPVDERAFINFEIDNLDIDNGQLAEARMQIQATDIDADKTYPDFTVSGVTGAWTEDAITWNTQPGFSGGFTVTDADATGGTYQQDGATLRRGLFNFDFTPLVQQWLGGTPDYGVALTTTEGKLDMASSEFFQLGVLPPVASLEFTNPAPLPANSTIDLGYVESGDLLILNYGNMNSSVRNIPPENARTHPAARQWLNFSGEAAPCLSGSLQMGVLMAEDTARAPYIELALQPDTTTIATGDSTVITPLVKFNNGGAFYFPEG